MILLPEDRIILTRLFSVSEKSVEIYEFHEKRLLSPAQLSRSVRKLRSEKIISFKDHKIKLTKSGAKWILRNRPLFFKVDKTWKEIPSEMQSSIEWINERIVKLPKSINKIKFKINKR